MGFLCVFEGEILVFDEPIHCFFEAGSRFCGNFMQVLVHFCILGISIFAILHVGLEMVQAK